MKASITFGDFYDLSYNVIEKRHEHIDQQAEKATFVDGSNVAFTVRYEHKWVERIFQRFQFATCLLIGEEKEGRIWHELFVEEPMGSHESFVVVFNFSPFFNKLSVIYYVYRHGDFSMIDQNVFEQQKKWMIPFTQYVLDEILSADPKLRLHVVTGSLDLPFSTN